MKAKKQKPLPTIPALTRKADKVFSEYVRRRDSNAYITDNEGLSIRAGNCCTCGRQIPTEGVGTGHCGHFIPRGCKLTRFHPQNAHLQCNYCNTYRDGEQYKHGVYIDKLYGEGVADELIALEALYKKDGYKFKRDELNGIIELYSRKLNEFSTL